MYDLVICVVCVYDSCYRPNLFIIIKYVSVLLAVCSM